MGWEGTTTGTSDGLGGALAHPAIKTTPTQTSFARLLLRTIRVCDSIITELSP
jgi:hypothetical protein